MSSVEVENEDGVAWVSLDRPPVNAFTQAMYDELIDVFARLAEPGQQVRAVILRGRGAHFCAGNDLTDLESMDETTMVDRLPRLRRALSAVYECDLPVVAAIHGSTVGAGVGLAASSDVVIAAHGTTLSIPELSAGVIGGASHMLRLAPAGMVPRLVLTGDAVGAEELLGHGKVHAVVARTDLDETAWGVVRRMLRHSPTGLRLAKQAMRNAEALPLGPAYEQEHVAGQEYIVHPDSRAALAATSARLRR